MDLVAGVKRVIVLMEHTVQERRVRRSCSACTLPLTGVGVVDRIITDLGRLRRRATGPEARRAAPTASPRPRSAPRPRRRWSTPGEASPRHPGGGLSPEFELTTGAMRLAAALSLTAGGKTPMTPRRLEPWGNAPGPVADGSADPVALEDRLADATAPARPGAGRPRGGRPPPAHPVPAAARAAVPRPAAGEAPAASPRHPAPGLRHRPPPRRRARGHAPRADGERPRPAAAAAGWSWTAPPPWCRRRLPLAAPQPTPGVSASLPAAARVGAAGSCRPPRRPAPAPRRPPRRRRRASPWRREPPSRPGRRAPRSRGFDPRSPSPRASGAAFPPSRPPPWRWPRSAPGRRARRSGRRPRTRTSSARSNQAARPAPNPITALFQAIGRLGNGRGPGPRR